MNIPVNINDRVPRGVRMLIRPSTCPNGDNILSHDWASLFLYEKKLVIRVFGCPHPPHVLPRYVLERLG